MSVATLPVAAKTERRDRHIEIFFDLGPSRADETPGTQYATVSVGHSKDRKEFYAVLNQKVEEDKSGPFAVTRYHPFDQINLARRSAARFSQKALEQFAVDVSSQLQDWMDSNPKVAARLTEPDHGI